MRSAAVHPPLMFHTTLYPYLLPTLGIWATGEGSWVIAALLQAKDFDEGLKDEVMVILKQNVKKLREVTTQGNKGAMVLLGML